MCERRWERGGIYSRVNVEPWRSDNIIGGGGEIIWGRREAQPRGGAPLTSGEASTNVQKTQDQDPQATVTLSFHKPAVTGPSPGEPRCERSRLLEEG